jgi:hypothetical protein
MHQIGIYYFSQIRDITRTNIWKQGWLSYDQIGLGDGMDA